MTTHVERSIEVEVPVRMAYDQWSRFEEFPRFMSGVEEVRRVGDGMTHWVAHIAGVRREWDAAIVEQVPDEKVAWAATTGATNAGAVFFDAVATDCTRVRLTLDFEPEGVVERIGDVLDVVQRQAVADLDRFKEFIEGQGSAAGGWRGTSEDGGVMSQEAQGQAIRQTAADDLPGDVVAVGPTGDTESTLTTDPSRPRRARRRPTTRRSGTAATPSPWTRRRSRATRPGRTRRGRRAAAVPARTAACATPAARASWSGTSRTRTSRRRTSSPGTSRTGTSPVRVSWSGTSRTATSPSATSRHRGIDPESAGAPISEPTTADRPNDDLGRGHGLGIDPCPRSFRGHTGDGGCRAEESACQRSVIAG